VIGCIDSRSDLTVMQERHYNVIFDNKQILEHCPSKNITSYSGHKVPVIGQVTCIVQFTNRGLSTQITIIIVRDISMTVPTLSFGNDLFKNCMATLSYTGIKGVRFSKIFMKIL
jgi:hypothetical protein